MPPIPIGLVGPDKSDCDRNYLVDPNCPLPSDSDVSEDNDKVVPFSWDDIETDKDNMTSTTEAVKVATQEVTKQIVEEITERILDATRKATEAGAAQGEHYSSTTGHQVINTINMPQDNEDDSFSVIMAIGGVVVTVVIVGSIGNI